MGLLLEVARGVLGGLLSGEAGGVPGGVAGRAGPVVVTCPGCSRSVDKLSSYLITRG